MFVAFDDEPTQHLVGAALRPGNAHPTRWAPCMLRRLVTMLRDAWPKSRLRVRLDGGYATPDLLDWLEYLGVEYLVGMPTNKRLKRIAEPLMKRARAEQKRSGETARRFGECSYATRKWPHERRIIIKAEVTVIAGREPRDNCRFLVTNLRHQPENAYSIYRKRGDVENRIKELLVGVDLGRTSCTSFLANSFRVLLSTAAYMLFQVLRELTDDPDLRESADRNTPRTAVEGCSSCADDVAAGAYRVTGVLRLGKCVQAACDHPPSSSGTGVVSADRTNHRSSRGERRSTAPV